MFYLFVSLASVHLPRIGHSTKGFNWYGTERLIRKHLSSRGIPTFIYYRSKAIKKTASPQTPATSTAAPQAPLLSSDRPTGERETEGPGPSIRQQSFSPVELPSFMKGVRVFFYNIPASERRRLGRYLLTYDGDEEDVMSEEITHIVAEVENHIQIQELQDLVRQYQQAVPVKKTWLESCFSKQHKVNAVHFQHQL